MPEKISICLNKGREESVGNEDVSIVRARLRDAKGDVKQNFSKRPLRYILWHLFIIIVFCCCILRYSLALRVISDILWSSCFESDDNKKTLVKRRWSYEVHITVYI